VVGKPKQKYDIWSVFAQKVREFEELSLVPDRDQMFAAEAGSNEMRGRVFGNLVLTEWAYLRIHEVLVVSGTHARREEYGYFLVIDGEEVWGYERDPTHDPPVHRHVGPDHRRERAKRITFKEVVELAWKEVSARSETRVRVDA
jgi:hypothetical protein